MNTYIVHIDKEDGSPKVKVEVKATTRMEAIRKAEQLHPNPSINYGWSYMAEKVTR